MLARLPNDVGHACRAVCRRHVTAAATPCAVIRHDAVVDADTPPQVHSRCVTVKMMSKMMRAQ
jgi:hypothetical protein